MSAQTNTSRNAGDFDVLNLGCGRDKHETEWNVDHNANVNPDETVDLENTPWPWPDNSFKTIRARHVLEHIEHVPWDELLRVLQPKGFFVFTYPIGHTRFEDPTHSQFWNVKTAETLAGMGKHSHEHVGELDVKNIDVKWWLNPRSIPFELWVRYRLWRYGVGPWLEQVPGLFGEVTAVYQLKHA